MNEADCLLAIENRACASKEAPELIRKRYDCYSKCPQKYNAWNPEVLCPEGQ